MKKKFIKIVILVILSIIIIPISAILPTEANDRQNNSLNLKNFTQNSFVNDWWSMFRKDSGNTGYSTSTAPITNHLNWKQVIPENLYPTTPIVSDDQLFISTNWYFYSEKLNLTISDLLEKPLFLPDIRQILMNHPTGEATGLYCLNANTGEQLWFYSFYAPNIPAIYNGKLYIVDIGTEYTSTLYCLNPTSGELIFKKTIDQLVLSPTIIAEEKIYLACFDLYGYSGSLNCYDLSGNPMWSYSLLPYELIWFSAPAVNDGIVSFISTNLYSYYGHIYGLNANNGGYLWSHPIFSLLYYYFGLPSAVCTNNRVYAIDFDINSYTGFLKCFNAQTGTIIWTTWLGSLLSLSTPAVDGDSVFFSGTDLYSYYNWLYRVYLSNGTIQWEVPIPAITYSIGGSPVCSANTIILSAGSYYGGSNEIYCFNKEDGMSLWQFYLDDITIGYPSIGDQQVYIADLYGKVYAFKDVLKIVKVAGGFMNVKMVLENIGNTNLTNINWTMSVKGGKMGMINFNRLGTIETLSAGKSKTVRALPIFGLGEVDVVATATMEGMNILQIKKHGIVFGPIVILNS